MSRERVLSISFPRPSSTRVEFWWLLIFPPVFLRRLSFLTRVSSLHFLPSLSRMVPILRPPPCFNSECWEFVHRRGLRAQHRWKGFSVGSPACVACCRSPAERTCKVCRDLLCAACFIERFDGCSDIHGLIHYVLYNIPRRVVKLKYFTALDVRIFRAWSAVDHPATKKNTDSTRSVTCN